MDMKDEQNLAPCDQERGLQPVLPCSARSQTSFSQVQAHRSGLESALARCQLRESHWIHRHTDLEVAFGLRLGNTVKSL